MFVSEGKTAAMPGRSIPGSVRNLIVVAATAAPVWPALTTASASPFFTRSTARLIGGILFSPDGFDGADRSSPPPGWNARSRSGDRCNCAFSARLRSVGCRRRGRVCDLRILAQRHDRAADEIGRPKIATHGVQSDFHRVRNLRTFGGECKTKIGAQVVTRSEAIRLIVAAPTERGACRIT